MARDLPASAGGILSYFTRHRTLANLLLIVVLLAGFSAIPNMRTQFFPDIVLGNVQVNVAWDNASSDDTDRAIVQVLNPVILGVDGVTETGSRTGDGWATIRVEFLPDWDMSRAVNDIEAAINAVTELPDDADRPRVERWEWTDRVTDVVITGPVSPEQLGLFADEMTVRLFAKGVTKAEIQGLVAPQTIIEVPAAQLVANDITMAEISAAIAAEVDTDPAGDVSGSNTRVRTGVEKRDPEQIGGILLRSNADGSKLIVNDIARVRRDGADRQRSFYFGENPAVAIRVNRTSEGDSIGIQRQVEQVAAELEATLPEGVKVDLIRTRSEAIESRLSILIENGLMGLALVVGLLFLFLNARTALWVAAGIPVAMMAAIAIMYLGGLTLNMISLFGLIITLGIVVDDAIVVGEHADFRARHYGEAPMQAAENAARRMAMPVFAATLTTVIAFAGLVVIGGRFGALIEDIPLTVMAVLIASLIECFLILPNHMAHALAAKAKERWYDWPSRQVNKGFNLAKERVFKPLMRGVIVTRYVVLACVVLVLASQVAIFIRGDVNWRFFNAPERSSITGNFVMLETATREDAFDMMLEMQRATEEMAREYEEFYGRNPVKFVLTQVGGNSGTRISGTEGKDPDLLGGIAIELIDAEERPYTSSAFVADLKDSVVKHPLAETISFRSRRAGPGGNGLNVRFFGAETEVLKQASLALQDAVGQFPEVTGLEDTLAYDKEELILDLTPRGQALGFTIDELGRVLRHRLAGIEVAKYPDGPRSAEIRVELPEDELTADFLERTQMRTPAGTYVPLADIVSVQQRIGFRTVRRENGVRVITVSGEISEDDPDRATFIETSLKEDILPTIARVHKVEWALSGKAEQESTFLSDALTGLILCLAGIYLVLAWVFASWTRPVVVMAIIPFGLVGTIYGHVAWDVPLSMFTVVGLLGMTGIIINDSIVLITTIDEYAKERGLIPSIVDGVADRLRPVMLTTLTTVLGLMPLLYETSRQAQFLKPTIITLVYGLGFGMVLVLLVVPALVAVQHDVARQTAAMRRALALPVSGVRRGYLALWMGILAWGGATMGWVLWSGDLLPQISQALPFLTSLSPMPAAFVVFVFGAAALTVLGYLALAVSMLRLSRAR